MKNNFDLNRKFFIGFFLITCSTLMYEILLTRIFSVTMWYHYAFMTISIAMFGMTTGSLVVYKSPNKFPQEKIHNILTKMSFSFGLFIIFSILIHLNTLILSKLSPICFNFINFLAISIPFIFSGIIVCLVLTRFTNNLGKLYAVDLAGAALGCIVLIFVLQVVDALSAVFIVALLPLISVFLFLDGNYFKEKLKFYSGIFIAIILCIVFCNVFMSEKQMPILRLTWVKGQFESVPLFEKWNSFSRVQVDGEPSVPTKPFGWGFGDKYYELDNSRKIKQLFLRIDSSAGTVLTKFDGNLSNYDYLKYDVTNIVNHLKTDSNVYIIGAGGGRDVLSALLFKQKSVTAVEINDNIIKAINVKFKDFTGHLNEIPKVKFVNDEARSYITRQKEKYDIIQASLIDTWAATAAGAFVLSENSLYTVQSWKTFLEHLSQNGVLSFSRWYDSENPAEIYRLVSLASSSLKDYGIKNPREHIILVAVDKNIKIQRYGGIGTILVSKSPFSQEDINKINKISEEKGFKVLLSPNYSADSIFTILTSQANTEKFVSNYRFNIAAPTDESPFFFNMLRIKDILNLNSLKESANSPNLIAIQVLMKLLLIVFLLTFFCVIFPLYRSIEKKLLKSSIPFLLFFASIGFGYMLIEISIMQKLIVFLGHPVYGLSVILFTLLLSSSLGSLLTQKSDEAKFKKIAFSYFIALLFSIAIFGLISSPVMNFFRGEVVFIRIITAISIIFIPGFFMGTAFPLGMQASSKKSELTPCFWGMNGAASVCASVLAVVISINSSITVSFWAGFSFYIIAFLSFIKMNKKIS